MYYSKHRMQEDIGEELHKARRKFPRQDVWITLAALTEEVGELNQAILQYTHQPEKNVTIEAIRKEAVQVAAMAMRVVLDTEFNEGKPSASE